MDLDLPAHLEARRRFFRDGRLRDLPRRHGARGPVLDLVAVAVLDEGEHVDERRLTERLAGVVDDPVLMRRLLVDSGRVHRTSDGSDYWLGQVPPDSSGGPRPTGA